ncbi:hypothetical protein Sps_03455 [Shewanella psychrophila]|uniref:Chromosome segregation ATPase n=1 Tax=Shewanella psychrophila TaxID=225848 RepID=A0A1S6HSV5_9GAMM|nr:hypothetical protein [Shewanella psychrophila]AQS38582.1 hypothetical protein Sps_03455 [Shewanella psychrophila]
MDIAEIKELISLLGSLGVGAVLGGGIIYFFIKSYIPSYLTEKAKNLATKEDISGITEQVETVKIGYAKILEEVRSDNQQQLASIEREKSIKKEVYLGASEALTRSQNMICSFFDLNIPNEEITKNMVGDSGIMAKIHIVGTKETVRATTVFMAAIGTKTLDLMLERSTLLKRKEAIEEVERLKFKAQQEIDRYIELMKNLNLQLNQDTGTWKAINWQVDFEQEKIEKHTKTIAELWERQGPEHIDFTRKCMVNFFEISALLPPIILAVRNELEMEISSEDYLDIFNDNLDKGRLVFDEFLAKVPS